MTKKIRYPVVIPESPPSYVPDTRMKRMMEDRSTTNLNYYSSKQQVIKDGKEVIVNFDKIFSPMQGYIPIEDFMESHLNSYDKFFEEFMRAFTNLNFKIIIYK